MREIATGIWHWTAKHPRIGLEVSSYFLPEQGVLLDPMLPPEGIDAIASLGAPGAILLTNRHHYRDCAALHEGFGVTVRAPRVGMHEFQPGDAVEPYDFGDELADGAVVAYEVGAICPDEAALHIPAVRALAVADGVVNYDDLRFVPDNLMDDPDDTKAALKQAYRRLATELDFDHLLCAHGAPVVGDGRDRLRAFAAA